VSAALKAYTSAAFQVRLRYPSVWTPVSGRDERFGAQEGFVQLSAVGGQGKALGDVCTDEISHKLLPYGTKPLVEQVQVAERDACLILPSADQPREMLGQAAVIVSYPAQVTIKGEPYAYFVLWADKDHVRSVASTLAFTAPSATTTREPVASATPTSRLATASPLPPTATVIPPTVPPTATSATTRVRIFLIALNDDGQSGKKVGCGDSVVGVDRVIPATQGLLRAALEQLLSLTDQYYGQSGLYNALYQSSLKVESVTIAAGKATVRLTGQLKLGGVCDNPRVEAQLRETALQFSTITGVVITVNGVPLEQLLSGG